MLSTMKPLNRKRMQEGKCILHKEWMCTVYGTVQCRIQNKKSSQSQRTEPSESNAKRKKGDE